MRTVLIVGAVLLLAGCGAEAGQPTSAPEPATGTGEVLGLDDREPERVVAALRELDACALLPDAATPVRTAPYSCLETGDITYEVGVGTYLDPIYGEREEIEVAGVVASTRSAAIFCDVALHVGAELAITFVARTTDDARKPQLCEAATEAAAAGAEVLADPEAAVADDDQQRDACDLLRRAGEKADIDVEDGTEVRFSHMETVGLGACHARVGPAADWSIRWGVRVDHTSFGSGMISSEGREDTLGDRDVIVEERDGCTYSWRVGSSGESGGSGSYLDKVHSATAETCEEAKTLAEGLMAVEKDEPADVEPQRPVTSPV